MLASLQPGSRSSRCSPVGRPSDPPRAEARVPLLSLVAYGVGGLLAAAIHPGQLEDGPFGYLGALIGVVMIAFIALVRGFRPV